MNIILIMLSVLFLLHLHSIYKKQQANKKVSFILTNAIGSSALRCFNNNNMAFCMELSTNFIMSRCGCGRSKAETKYKEIVVFCKEGPDYVPTICDFARFHNWSEVKVLFYTHATMDDITRLYKEERMAEAAAKTLVIESKFGGKETISIPPEKIEELIIDVLKITDDGIVPAFAAALNAQQKEQKKKNKIKK